MQQIFEGKTTNEAIEKGLKELGITKEMAEIKVLEEDKKSFFSILAPRIVRVEIKVKEEKREVKKERNIEELKKIDFEKATTELEKFLNEFISKIPGKNINFNINVEDYYIKVNIEGEDLNYLIGYRGEVLNNLQNVFSSIASKDSEYKVKVILNICGYKERREKALEDLAEKIAKTVLKTRKSVTLEPMTAYERKIIHAKLQNHSKVKTTSIGEEPYRKVVISIK